MDSYLSSYVPSSADEIWDYCEISKTDGRERALRLANAAWARIVRFTRRDLTRRTYRLPTTIVCALTSGSKTVTGAGFGVLRAFDPVLGSAALPPDVLVASITDPAHLELTAPAINDAAAPALTFGSAPLSTRRVTSREILIPQFPVSQVIAAYDVDDTGALASIDTTGAILEPTTGLYTLVNAADAFDRDAVGAQPGGAIAVECVAGYARPSGTERGDPQWYDLQEAVHRLTAYLVSDRNSFRSRATSAHTGPLNLSTPDFRMPLDVADILKSYMRRW